MDDYKQKALNSSQPIGSFKYLHSAGWHRPSVYYCGCFRQALNNIYTQWGYLASQVMPLAIWGLTGHKVRTESQRRLMSCNWPLLCYFLIVIVYSMPTWLSLHIKLKYSLGTHLWDISLFIMPISGKKQNLFFLTGNGVDSSSFCLQVNPKWLSWR